MINNQTELERKIASCLAIALDPSASDWAKKFWKETAEKLSKKLKKF